MGIINQQTIKSETTLWIIAFAAIICAYFVQFQLVGDIPLLRSFKLSLINIVPIILPGIAVRLIVRRFLLQRPVIVQFIAHIFLAIIFAHLWYVLILVADSFRPDWFRSGIKLSPFYGSATLWQLLQGIVIYASMQGLIYGRWLHEQLQQARLALVDAGKEQADPPDNKSNAIFVKIDGDYRKLDLVDLVHLEADGDQVLLHTKFDHFTSHQSLSSYAAKLDDSGYIRVHRSHLVRASEVLAAEPTGDGRLSIHLSNGTTIVASRTGSRAFRDYTK